MTAAANAVVLLEGTHAHGERVRLARALADDVNNPKIQAVLTDDAGETERRAKDVETTAVSLRRAAERSRNLPRQMSGNLSETRQPLSQRRGELNTANSHLMPQARSHPHMSGNSVDPGLRDRLSRSAEEALQRLDKVLAEPAPARIAALRQALDELMRAAARVRLELESGASGDHERSGNLPPRPPSAAEGVIPLPIKKLD